MRFFSPTDDAFAKDLPHSKDNGWVIGDSKRLLSSFPSGRTAAERNAIVIHCFLANKT